MIDLHSHLLPGIDDGAPNLEASLSLVHHAVDQGITHMVFTPHIHPGRYDNDILSINAAHQRLKEVIEKHAIPLKTACSAEVRISIEMIDLIQNDQIPFILNHLGEPVILLEFPHSHILPGSEKLVKLLKSKGITPMIAHPERNKDVMRDLNKIEVFVELGCLLQLTAGSVAGGFGPQAQRCAISLLERGWVSILASDAHNLHRLPELEPGRRVAATIVGEEESYNLVIDNPAKISAGMFGDPDGDVSQSHGGVI